MLVERLKPAFIEYHGQTPTSTKGLKVNVNIFCVCPSGFILAFKQLIQSSILSFSKLAIYKSKIKT